MRLTILILLLAQIAPAASSAELHTDLPKALAEAKAHDKPVFIYVYDSI